MTRTNVQDQCTVELFVAAAAALQQSDNSYCEMMSFLLVAIPRSGLYYLFEARHPSRLTAHPHKGVHTVVYFIKS